MSETISMIGSRIVIPKMIDDLKFVLNDLKGLRGVKFATGGCEGISTAVISYCIENNICGRLNIWLAKRLMNARQDLLPMILKAQKRGAKIIESNCKYYLDGLICRNKEMIVAGNACYAWRLNKSKGTTHELNNANKFNKKVVLTDYCSKNNFLNNSQGGKNYECS